MRNALELFLERDERLLVPAVSFCPNAKEQQSPTVPGEAYWLTVMMLEPSGNGETHSRLGPPYGWYVLSSVR